VNPIRFILRDDTSIQSWEPFALTRPVGELVFGTLSLRRRAERRLGLSCEGYLLKEGAGREHLARTSVSGSPPVTAHLPPDPERPTLVLSARVALDAVAGGSDALEGMLAGDEPGTLTLNGVECGWFAPAGKGVSDSRGAAPALELAGTLLVNLWDLVASNSARLWADLEPRRRETPDSEATVPHVIGDHPVRIAPGANVEPGVVIDARSGAVTVGYGAKIETPARLEGPVALGPGVSVSAFTRLVGPVFVGAGSRVLGGEIAASRVGRHSRVRGEVAYSIVGDFANKAHEGHVAHSIIGDWVNLGAGTIISNLKNNYAPIRVRGAAGSRKTDLVKLGALIGDYARTGIGTLIGTGSIIGAGSNIFGGGMASGFIPPFSWTDGTRSRYRVDDFVESLARMMARRGQEMTPALESRVRRVWEASVP